MSIQDRICKVQNRIKNFVVRLNVEIGKIDLLITDQKDEEFTTLEIDIGTLEILMDEVFNQKHFVKVLGLSVESRTHINVIGVIADVYLPFCLTLLEVCKLFERS